MPEQVVHKIEISLLTTGEVKLEGPIYDLFLFTKLMNAATAAQLEAYASRLAQSAKDPKIPSKLIKLAG
jgi:hypothetical protein